MKYYQELSLLHNTDIGLYFLWQKLYQQIHLAIVENKNADNVSSIGVAFPAYDAAKFSLGTKLRLFAGDVQTLEQMQCDQWLNRLNDYVRINRIEPVPEKIMGYACFKHIKLKGNMEKLARRRAKRKGETFQEALANFEDFKGQQSNLPYLKVISQTNGQHFRLYIEKQIMEHPQEGGFSCYGLSNTSTVPLF